MVIAWMFPVKKSEPFTQPVDGWWWTLTIDHTYGTIFGKRLTQIHYNHHFNVFKKHNGRSTLTYRLKCAAISKNDACKTHNRMQNTLFSVDFVEIRMVRLLNCVCWAREKVSLSFTHLFIRFVRLKIHILLLSWN